MNFSFLLNKVPNIFDLITVALSGEASRTVTTAVRILLAIFKYYRLKPTSTLEVFVRSELTESEEEFLSKKYWDDIIISGTAFANLVYKAIHDKD